MLTDGLECCGLLWCFYQTLILTAPIHCRASIAETLMQRHISTNLMKKQTHPDLGFSFSGWTIPLMDWCMLYNKILNNCQKSNANKWITDSRCVCACMYALYKIVEEEEEGFPSWASVPPKIPSHLLIVSF